MTGAAARSVLLLLMALAAMAAGVTAARAHASLLSSQPADGAMLAQAPAAATLTFNEPVSVQALRLIGPDATTTVLPMPNASATLTVALPALAQGTHLLSWRVISADGHPVGGSLIFSVGRITGPPAAATDTPAALKAGIVVLRIAIYLGLFVGVGGAVFGAWIAPLTAAAQRAVTAALLVGLIASVPALGLQGLDSLGAPLRALAQAAPWQAGLRSSYALSLALAALAMLLALAGTRRKLLALGALALVGAALAASGHASTAPPQWLMRPTVFAHAVAVALWVGSLLPLCAALGRPDRTALARFSALITVPVLVLLASGFGLAWRQIDRIATLPQTAYGRILIAKLALVAVLLLLAAVNRAALTRPALAGSARAITWLRRSIAAEIVLALAILGVVALWRFTPPPRVLALAEPAFVHLHDVRAMADLTLTPGRAGPVKATLRLLREDFTPLPAKEVTLTLSDPAAGIEAMTRPARSAGDGTWQADGFHLPVGGRWEVRIEVLVSDFEKIVLDGPVLVQP